MRTSPTMASLGASVPQEFTRILAETDPRTRDRIVSAVGVARRNALPIKASAVARACGHSETMESRIRSGERMSATAVAAMMTYIHAAEEDARPLDAAGYRSAYINATLNAIAMWPTLELMTTEELHAELRRVAREIATGSSHGRVVEAACSEAGEIDLDALQSAATRQATAHERLMAITQVLADR